MKASFQLPGIQTFVFAALFMVHANTNRIEQNLYKKPGTEPAIAAILSRYELKPDGGEKLIAALKNYVNQATKQTGNIMAEAYHEQENPTVLWLIERWNSKEELDKNRMRAEHKMVSQLSETDLKQPVKTIYIKDLEPLSKNEWRRSPHQDDKPITIMLFVHSRLGTEKSFKTVYHKAMPQFRSEPGVINYQLSQLEDDSTQFVTYEKFRNDEAFQYHLNFPPIQPVLDYLNTSIKKQPFQAGLHRLIEFAPLNRQ